MGVCSTHQQHYELSPIDTSRIPADMGVSPSPNRNKTKDSANPTKRMTTVYVLQLHLALQAG